LEDNPGPCEQFKASRETKNCHGLIANQLWRVFIRESKLESGG
jgi:hypothetical protein